MARKIGAVIALDGEQQFKNAVTACTKSLNNMKSALKLVETQTAGQKNSLEALQKKHDALNNVLGAAKAKQEAVAKEFEKSKRSYEDIGKKLDEYKDKLAEAKEKLEKMKASGEATDEELEKQEQAVKKAAEAVERAEKSYESAGNRAEDWQRRLNDATTETTKAEQAVNENADAMKELEKATNEAGGELDDFADSADDAEDSTGELEISLKSMIKNAAVGLLADGFKELASKAGEAAKYVMQVGSDFEAGMSKVGAVSGASSKEMEQLSAKAKQMGATTKFSATEAAEAMEYMAMAGWKTGDMLSGIEGIMNLAAASGEELATTSDIVTDALTAFGKTAEESGRLADIMAAASSNANTNVSMMGETFKYAAPVAGALGATMEDTAIAVGLMANSGIKASQAGTALRTGLSNLAKPTKQMKEWMDKYNISLVENEDGSVNLRETMVQLREKMGQLSETEQAAAASAIFGKNAMSGWMAIINASDEDFNKLADAIDNSDGAAKEMMETMGDNLQGKIKLLGASLEGLGIALYDKISGPLKIAVDAAAGAISGLTEVLQDHRTENELALDQIRNANEEMQKSIENSRSIMENAEIDASNVGVLGEALVNLNEQENLSASQKEALKGIYDELVKVVPDLAKYYNEETGKIDLTREALEKLIKTRREEIIEQGRIKAAQELLEAYGEAHAQLDLAMAKSEGMKAQKKMWEDLRDRIGEAQSAYVNLARDSQGNIIDTKGLEGLRDELLNVAQAALNSGTITTSTYDEIAEMFKDDDWSESELIAAYDKLQGKVEETDIAIGDMNKEVDAATKGAEEASQEYNNYTKYIEGASESAENFAAVSRDSATSTSDMRDEMNDLHKKTKDVTEATEEATEAIDKQTDSLDEHTEATDEARRSAVENRIAEKEAAVTYEEATDALEDKIKAVHDAAEAQKNLRDAYLDAKESMKSSFDEIKKSAEDAFSVDPFSKWQQDAEKGMLAFEEAMKSQIDGMLMYKDNLTTVKDNLGETAPEFVQYLEDMGQGGAQFVAEIADAFRTGNADTVYRLMDEYKQAMDIQSDVATILEQDKLALIVGLESLSPEAIRAWEDLGYAFDEGNAVIEAKGGEMAQTTRDSFWQAVDIAKQTGMEVPAGLAESIRNSEDPEQALIEATAQLNESIRGRGEEMLAAAKELGINVPSGIAEIIKDPEASQEQVQAAVMTLRDSIAAKKPDFEQVGTETGEGMADSTATGITNKEGDVTGAADSVVNSAKTTATTAGGLFRMVGKSAMEMYKSGMLDKKQEINTAAVGIASNASETMRYYGERVFSVSGKSAMEMYKNGMFEKKQEINTAAVGIVSNVNETVKLYGERVFEATGKSIGGKLGEGILQAQGSINSQIQTMLRKMTTTMAQSCAEMSRIVSSTYLRFPDIQIPHVRWTWDTIYYGDGGWTQVPNFWVDWYAKAMDKGMILDNPTIFGTMNGKLLGAGEAGSETVVGTDSLMSMIDNAVRDAVAPEAAYDDVSRKLDSLIAILGQYMPEVIDGMQSGMVFEPDGSYMGKFRKKLSSEIAMDVRRARA